MDLHVQMKVMWHFPNIFMTQIWGADGRDGGERSWYFNTFLHIFCGFCLVWLCVWGICYMAPESLELYAQSILGCTWWFYGCWLRPVGYPTSLKGPQIIFKGFCGHDFSFRLRKKKRFISPWRLRRKEGGWDKEGQGSNGKIGKRKREKASGLEIWKNDGSMNGGKKLQSGIVFLCFKYPISRAVNRQTIIAAGTLDYIRVQNKLCSPWFMISSEPSGRINDITWCDSYRKGDNQWCAIMQVRKRQNWVKECLHCVTFIFSYCLSYWYYHYYLLMLSYHLMTKIPGLEPGS